MNHFIVRDPEKEALKNFEKEIKQTTFSDFSLLSDDFGVDINGNKCEWEDEDCWNKSRMREDTNPKLMLVTSQIQDIIFNFIKKNYRYFRDYRVIDACYVTWQEIYSALGEVAGEYDVHATACRETFYDYFYRFFKHICADGDPEEDFMQYHDRLVDK